MKNPHIFEQIALINNYLNTYQKVRQSAIEHAVSEGILMAERNVCTFKSFDADWRLVIYDVKNLNDSKVYSVYFKFSRDMKMLNIESNDPLKHLQVSSHRYGAAIALRKYLMGLLHYDQKLTVLDMEYIDHGFLQRHSGRLEQAQAQMLLSTGKVSIVKQENKTVLANVSTGKETHRVSLTKASKTQFNTSCTCNESGFPVCTHKLAVFFALIQQFGVHYFDQQRDWTEEKNKMLEPYGFTVNDDLSGKFEFKLQGNYLTLIQLDPTIQKLSKYQNWGELQKRLFARVSTVEDAPVRVTGAALKNDTALGFAIALETYYFPYFEITPFTAKLNEARTSFKSSFAALDPSIPVIDVNISPDEQAVLDALKNLEVESLNNYLGYKRNPKYNRWAEPEYAGSITEEEKPIVMRYLHQNVSSIFKRLVGHPHVFRRIGQTVSKQNTEPILINNLRWRPYFKFELTEEFAILTAYIAYIDPKQPDFAKASKRLWRKTSIMKMPIFVYEKNKNDSAGILTLAENSDDALALAAFGQQGELKVHRSDAKGFFDNIILPLMRQYPVELPEEFEITELEMPMSPAIYLNEAEESFLVIKPLFQYGEKQALYDRNNVLVDADAEKPTIIKRDLIEEQKFYDFIADLHPSFEEQRGSEYFYLPFELATQNNWFFELYDKLHETQIPIFGYAKLQKFKYNPNRPKFDMKFSSGIDWFDVTIELSYGDQQVKLKDLKKAILKKQNYIQLGDGSIGMLPQEWLEKYSLLFRMGQQAKKGLRLSKYHFTVIDELYEQIDDLELQRQLQDKRDRLANFDKIGEVPLPENVQATLRPYQVAAFNWFNFLDSVKWGGCLADDMGLGKTLQALTFLQYLQNKNPNSTHLIVAPRTLLFNWENEIQKFTPTLTFMVHHGLGRAKSAKVFNDFNLILTTYGTLRSDVEMFADFNFHYIVLDESQAIKNPGSQIAKAVQTLQADNRIILTGTPVQNNTFELYTQMNFLNPGLLGNMEFFKEEYASPIDRDEDMEKAQELKRLIFPFMLRRTKEQVAPDLPEKTEMVLYCEMGAKQRKIYNGFRDDIRDKIMGKINENAENALSNASMYILQGLMKLRQICDSPALLPDEGDFGNESVKLTELMREIEENVGQHKALVFSQFIGMLALIRDALEKAQIPYEYLDGSTKDRKGAVDRFQNDDSVRVFLISLTAGGVGLNLTAADYVYIVDPWWNPAVEQQAIDRTHRIGQQKNIFAYKMICKDTIEEKILNLQQKKKKLADDLISDDAGFIKKLTKEDLAYLFS